MALAAITGSLANYLLQTRTGVSSGAPYTALVSDLAAGDFIVGTRATVTATGATTSGNRSLTLSRLGFTWTATLPAASSVAILR